MKRHPSTVWCSEFLKGSIWFLQISRRGQWKHLLQCLVRDYSSIFTALCAWIHTPHVEWFCDLSDLYKITLPKTSLKPAELNRHHLHTVKQVIQFSLRMIWLPSHTQPAPFIPILSFSSHILPDFCLFNPLWGLKPTAIFLFCLWHLAHWLTYLPYPLCLFLSSPLQTSSGVSLGGYIRIVLTDKAKKKEKENSNK